MFAVFDRDSWRRSNESLSAVLVPPCVVISVHSTAPGYGKVSIAKIFSCEVFDRVIEEEFSENDQHKDSEKSNFNGSVADQEIVLENGGKELQASLMAIPIQNSAMVSRSQIFDVIVSAIGSLSAELVVAIWSPQRRTRKKKQFSDLKNRVGELRSEIEVATANIEEAKQIKESMMRKRFRGAVIEIDPLSPLLNFAVRSKLSRKIRTHFSLILCLVFIERSILVTSEASSALVKSKESVIGSILRLECDVQIGSLDRRMVLLRFVTEDECKRTLMRVQTEVDGVYVWLSRWTPEWYATLALIEGAYLEDGKGISNWDVFFCTINGKIQSGENGNAADDHYHRYLEDIDLMHDLEDRYGGRMSYEMQEDFVYFAEVYFESFGDRMKYWITINEPNLIEIAVIQFQIPLPKTNIEQSITAKLCGAKLSVEQNCQKVCL